MSEGFNSPIFGPTRRATEDELIQIAKLMDDVPVAVFQALNKRMNSLNLMISIDILGGGH